MYLKLKSKLKYLLHVYETFVGTRHIVTTCINQACASVPTVPT